MNTDLQPNNSGQSSNDNLNNISMDTSSKYIIALSIIIAGGLIAGATAFAIIYTHNTQTQANSLQAVNHQNPQDTQPTNQQQPTVDIKKVHIDNEPYIGDNNAPLTIAYWTDYQCPFCQKFELEALPNLMTNYVKKHKLKIVFKDFQFLGSDSITAGIAARAVWELYPDRYYDWRQAMYQNQGPENSGYDSKTNIVKLTRTITGIDADKVSQLMDQKKNDYILLLNADQSEGAQYGVRGTPTFIIGNQMYPGVIPYQNFSQLIDAELKLKNS